MCCEWEINGLWNVQFHIEGKIWVWNWPELKRFGYILFSFPTYHWERKNKKRRVKSLRNATKKKYYLRRLWAVGVVLEGNVTLSTWERGVVNWRRVFWFDDHRNFVLRVPCSMCRDRTSITRKQGNLKISCIIRLVFFYYLFLNKKKSF